MYQSEKGIHLILDITDEATGLPADLDGATVLFRMSPRGEDVVLEKTCVVVAPGVVEVIFENGDLDLPAGHYRREWRYFRGDVAETVYEDEKAIRRSQFYDL